MAVRRALGYKLADNERLLRQFLDHLERAGLSTITTEAAVAWGTLPTRAKPIYWRRRLSVVRGYARHLNALDPACEVPPGILPCFANRVPPHLFSDQEILSLMSTPGRVFRQALRVATHRLLIGLLSVTGLRTGDAVRLDREHVDLDAGILAIVDSKYGKSRQVLLSPSTVTELHVYAELRDQAVGPVGAPAFFVSAQGRLQVNTVDYTFATLVKAAGIRDHRLGRYACRSTIAPTHASFSRTGPREKETQITFGWL
ncbi:site-specific recombinase XerD [Nonomuraea polychroma]|uniref:Site-specific recombinase XerD n=1 Tax=Nonomuraea polychroma TaxID=46176 RepID=A0A438M871_9ACTN|nr:tyrosine-type recombinase/integrase [Nonomuraea polychroma]RVX41924.1 site-specific recombinase XerD [Nonomuraea polychroma]